MQKRTKTTPAVAKTTLQARVDQPLAARVVSAARKEKLTTSGWIQAAIEAELTRSQLCQHVPTPDMDVNYLAKELQGIKQLTSNVLTQVKVNEAWLKAISQSIGTDL